MRLTEGKTALGERVGQGTATVESAQHPAEMPDNHGQAFGGTPASREEQANCVPTGRGRMGGEGAEG